MRLVLVRHGATDWSVAGRHTGRTDVPLNALGRVQAADVKTRVAINVRPAPPDGIQFWSSPLARALSTARTVVAAGVQIRVDPRLSEFDYGDYEGLTTPEIRTEAPGWTTFDGCPGGESLADVEGRVDSVLADLRSDPAAPGGTVVIFAHGHLLRILGARAIGQPGSFGVRLGLDTGSVSVIDDLRDGPAITLWNDIRH